MESRNVFVVAGAVLVSAVVGAVAGNLAASRSAERPAGSLAAAPSDSGRFEALEARQDTLAKALDELRGELRSQPAADSRVAADDSALDGALARYMALHAAPAPRAETKPLDPAAAAREKDGAVADALRRLLDPKLTDLERQRLWKEFAEQGLLDALVAEYEKRAERDPNNPDLQVELGEAYLQKVFASDNGPETGRWATKADQVFDAALELDGEHWDARFHKAVSLSFWPPMFGKQKEAIAHFETLVAQQAGQPKEARFAQTHLFLGNMYLQLGQRDKALAAWEGGLAQFPGDEELRKQLELNRGQ